MAASEGAKEALYLKRFLEELGRFCGRPSNAEHVFEVPEPLSGKQNDAGRSLLVSDPFCGRPDKRHWTFF